jgi:hypothetical protein
LFEIEERKSSGIVHLKDDGAIVEQSPPITHLEKNEVTISPLPSYNLKSSSNNGMKNSSGEQLSIGGNNGSIGSVVVITFYQILEYHISLRILIKECQNMFFLIR